MWSPPKQNDRQVIRAKRTFLAPPLRFFVGVGLALLLTSCVETKNVTVFASSVSVVTDATSRVLDAERSNCASINAVVSEAETLPGLDNLGSADCRGLEATLDAIARVNTVLANYGKALSDISQGSFVNYDSDSAGLESALKALPKDTRPSDDQINATVSLAGWVASLVTEEQREKAIQDAMIGRNGEMKSNFHKVVVLLQHLASHYSEALDTNIRNTTMIASLVSHKFRGSEPVAVAEFSRHMSERAQATRAQEDMIKQYVAALDAMSKAFDAATEKPRAKELLPEVRAFAKQARSVSQSMRQAFSNS